MKKHELRRKKEPVKTDFHVVKLIQRFYILLILLFCNFSCISVAGLQQMTEPELKQNQKSNLSIGLENKRGQLGIMGIGF